MKKNNTSLNSDQPFITEIQVEDLYDLYTYNLSVPTTGKVDLSQLLILYGDNGSGKTTLLKLIFHLLSPTHRRGHRTYVASTPFRRFAIKIGRDTQIIIEKQKGQLLGSFNATVIKSNKLLFDDVIVADERNVVLNEEPSVFPYVSALNQLNIALYYLSDDRKTESSFLRSEEEPQSLALESGVYVVQGGRVQRKKASARSEQVLELAIKRVEGWLRLQALRGATEGEAKTNDIYTDIIKRIARTKGTKEKKTRKDVDELLLALREIEGRLTTRN